MHVIIVNDNASFRASLRDTFSMRRIPCEEHSSAEALLAAIDGHVVRDPQTLVILDENMGDMLGSTALVTLRLRHPSLLVFANSRTDNETLLAAGAQGTWEDLRTLLSEYRRVPPEMLWQKMTERFPSSITTPPA